jgi:DNA-binding NarL/FixJ family response regulator
MNNNGATVTTLDTTPTRKTRILLVEDHAILREGLCALLELEADFTIVGNTGDVVEALAAVERLQPHLVISDIALPGRSGIELIGELRARFPQTRVLVLTAHTTDEYIRAALNAGAHGTFSRTPGARSSACHSGWSLQGSNTCVRR